MRVLFSRKIFPLQLQVSHRNHSIKAIVAYLSFQATSSSRSIAKNEEIGFATQSECTEMQCSPSGKHYDNSPRCQQCNLIKIMLCVVGIRHNTLLKVLKYMCKKKTKELELNFFFLHDGYELHDANGSLNDSIQLFFFFCDF